MRLICDYCNRDLNEIWQDNMSPDLFTVICEDCSGHTQRKLDELRNKNE